MTKQQEQGRTIFRDVVIDEELKARFWKAKFEAMEYYLSAREITPRFRAAYAEDMAMEAEVQEQEQVMTSQILTNEST